ncbi:MAG TPA: EamA family transporter [Verrucomicrobiae bacterium]
MNPTATVQPASRAGLIAAFATIYVVWGSTYLAMLIAIQTLPPFLMAGMRFLFAGSMLFLWLRLRGEPLPARQNVFVAAAAGGLMLLGGNGLVAWAEQSIASGLTALLIALTPVWFTLLEWIRPGGRRPAGQTLLGIVIGFLGMIWLVAGRSAGGPTNAIQSHWGVVALMVAGISWAAGSLLTKYKMPPHSSVWMNAAVQMICGGALLLVVGGGLGESQQLHWAQVSRASWLALAYLVLVGSWIGYGAYIWLLKHSQPAHVATYAYVNPVIALMLGSLVMGEKLNIQMLWAAAVILVGVVIITLPKRMVPG